MMQANHAYGRANDKIRDQLMEELTTKAPCNIPEDRYPVTTYMSRKTIDRLMEFIKDELWPDASMADAVEEMIARVSKK